MTKVYGAVVDSHTRCVHYHLDLDIIAIKFKCCGRFYPCYMCHEQDASHCIETWPKEELDSGERVILCGECHALLGFNEYSATGKCVQCGAQFNPKCSLHYRLYFDV